jgi:hypothetical protein
VLINAGQQEVTLYLPIELFDAVDACKIGSICGSAFGSSIVQHDGDLSTIDIHIPDEPTICVCDKQVV